jgi:hypothetical protein
MNGPLADLLAWLSKKNEGKNLYQMRNSQKVINYDGAKKRAYLVGLSEGPKIRRVKKEYKTFRL